MGLKQGLKARFIHQEFLLTCDECGQVHGKSKGVVQLKHHIARQLVALVHPRSGGGKTFHPRGKGAQEGLFFLFNDLFNQAALGFDFGESVRHLVVQYAH